MQSTFEFELENVANGPNPLSLATLAETNDFVVLFFQQDYYCTNCRTQI